jgi:nucleotide-binding universal stress UspA family protein
MFSRLLVGTDGSDSAAIAVAQSVAMAKKLGTELLVLHSFPVAKGEGGMFSGAPLPSKDIGISILEDVQKRYGKQVGLKTLLKEGAPADAIVDVAEEEKVDLIIVGNKGMTGARRFVLGSVPNTVSHHAPTSVLIVDTTGPHAEARRGGELYRTILVATDGSPTAGRAAEAGAQLAAALNADLLLLSVGAEEQTKHVLEQAASHLKGLGVKKIDTKSVAGDPADMIVDIAEKEDIELIVVGNRGMTGSKRFVLGSVPNHVSHHSPSDVLIVKTT